MGLVLILNNEKFDIPNVSERKNSRKDVMALKSVFYKFNYSVKTVTDPTLQQIRENLNESLMENLKTASCLVVALMTHGLEYDHAYAKDQIYNIGDVILNSKAFQEYKGLPKILITQACKNVDKDLNLNSESKVPKVYNTFRYNSCFEGEKSVRADEGTLFIQKLCKCLHKFGLMEDLESIAINRINKSFAEKFKRDGINQCPTIVKYTGGFETFYFGNDVKKEFALKEKGNKSFIVG